MAARSFDTDVIIVGASLAGSSLALRLAQAGIRSVLIDRAHFPRRKPCGEGLSAIGVRALQKLQLKEKLLAAPHQPYFGYRIWNSYGATELAVQTDKEPRGVGIQRLVLDQVILSAALLNRDVDGIFGEIVREIHEVDTGYEVRTNTGPILARHVVLADGANSMLRRKLALPLQRPSTKRVAWSMSFVGQGAAPPQELINIFLAEHYEVYCTALGENRMNISILSDDSAKLAMLREEKQLSPMLQEVKQALRCEGELADPPLGMAGFGAAAEKSWWHGVLLIGDCAESLDPIGGMGMTHALESSALAADALIAVLQEGKNPAAEFETYHAKREEVARPLRTFTRMVHAVLSRLGRSSIFSQLGKLPVSSAVIKQLLYRDRAASPSLAARLLENIWGR